MRLYTDNGFEYKLKLSETFSYPRYDLVERPLFNDRSVFVVDNPSRVVQAFLYTYPQGGVVVFSAHLHLNGWVRDILPGLRSDQLVYVGTREAMPEEVVTVNHLGLKRYPMQNMMQEGVTEIVFALMETVRSMKEVCVVIDLSVVDPAFVKVENPSFGGLTSRELLFFVQKLKMLDNVKGFGIVGNDPLAQKILTEFY